MSTAAERLVTPLSTIREVKPGSFIFERPLALPPAFCDEVVDRFEAHPEQQHEGRIGQIRTKDRSIKVTTDLVVSDKEDWKDVDQMFFRSLAAALREFRETFPYFKGRFKDMGYQVQRYRPGEFFTTGTSTAAVTSSASVNWWRCGISTTCRVPAARPSFSTRTSAWRPGGAS